MSLGKDAVTLREMPIEDLQEAADSRAWTTSDPPKYRLVGDKIYFDRPNTSDSVIGLYVRAHPTAVLTGQATVVYLSPLQYEWLLLDVQVKLSQRDRRPPEDTQALMTERARLEALIHQAAEQRDEHARNEPRTVRKVYRAAWDEMLDVPYGRSSRE